MIAFDACSLLTAEEIADALSIDASSIGDGETLHVPHVASCTWLRSDGRCRIVDVNVDNRTGEEMRNPEAYGGQVIAGIGDKAAWLYGALWMVSGDFQIGVHVGGESAPGQVMPSEEEQKAAAIELAEIALARLPR